MRPKLGQNFLRDKNKIIKIIDALCVQKNETIIEVGPGHGELTFELGTRIQAPGNRLIAIEKDERLAKNLKSEVKNLKLKNIEIIAGDVLKTLPQATTNHLKPAAYKIVGNIPYYLTGFLLRTVGELKNKPRLTIITVQKEVALRICAVPPKMNLLAASLQAWAKPKIIGFIPGNAFWPKPKVDSAILALKTRTNGKKTPKNYYSLTKIIFQQPRKTIFNNLKRAQLTSNDKILNLLRQSRLSPNLRPQDLSVATLKKLAIMLYNDY